MVSAKCAGLKTKSSDDGRKYVTKRYKSGLKEGKTYKVYCDAKTKKIQKTQKTKSVSASRRIYVDPQGKRFILFKDGRAEPYSAKGMQQQAKRSISASRRIYKDPQGKKFILFRDGRAEPYSEELPVKGVVKQVADAPRVPVAAKAVAEAAKAVAEAAKAAKAVAEAAKADADKAANKAAEDLQDKRKKEVEALKALQNADKDPNKLAAASEAAKAAKAAVVTLQIAREEQQKVEQQEKLKIQKQLEDLEAEELFFVEEAPPLLEKKQKQAAPAKVAPLSALTKEQVDFYSNKANKANKAPVAEWKSPLESSAFAGIAMGRNLNEV
jgi:hypothetical protein